MKSPPQEQWAPITGFSDYSVSNLGRIFNHRTDRVMQTSRTNHGHVKITLVMDNSRRRHTLSVSTLVATAFVESPHILCDHVMVLDGDLGNVAASNLVWRPRGFAWKYAHQLKTPQPVYYQNLPVYNPIRRVEYPSIISAGMHEGLLFADIWRSTYSGAKLYPDGSVFEIVNVRV